MKFPHPISVRKIADRFGAKLIGDDRQQATGINEIHKVEPGDITFVDIEKYYHKSLHSPATTIIINKEVDCPPGKALLICENPFEVYDQLVREYRPFRPLTGTISDSALVHPSSIIEPNVIIGPNVRIGKNCYIQANVVIGEYTVIGDNVIIQSGSVIGSDAFYFKRDTERGYKKWRSGGRVVIHNEVDIGAICTINRGVSGDTIIGKGSKLDSQVHIGHGVVLGNNCLIAAQVGIGGKTVIGNEVTLYGQVGIAHNLHIGDRVTVLAKSGVGKDLASGKTYFGAPAGEVKTKFREVAALRKLPEFLKRFN